LHNNIIDNQESKNYEHINLQIYKLLISHNMYPAQYEKLFSQIHNKYFYVSDNFNNDNLNKIVDIFHKTHINYLKEHIQFELYQKDILSIIYDYLY
jgi:hypothetical protein